MVIIDILRRMWCQYVLLVTIYYIGFCVGNLLSSRMDYLQQRTDELLSQLKHYETIIPQRVTHQGNFLSYHVTHSSVLRHRNGAHSRPKRRASSDPNSNQWNDTGLYFDEDNHVGRNSIYYKLSAYGRDFHFNLSINNQLLSKDFAVEYITNYGTTVLSKDIWDCHYVGKTLGSDVYNTAISNCHGLHGVFSTNNDDYFLEPLWNHTNNIGETGHPHVVYRRSSLKVGDISQHCGVKDYRRRKYAKLYRKRPGSYNSVLKQDHQYPYWRWRPKGRRNNKQHFKRKKSRSRGRRRRIRRSVSKARHVETFVVLDKKMMDFHVKGSIERGTELLTTYVLTVMNIVAKLFHNPSVGNHVNIIVTKLAVLGEEKGKNLPHINHHADKSLDNFCKWQHELNQRSNTSLSHDNAILITRYDICTYKNKPCGTLDGAANNDSQVVSPSEPEFIRDSGLAPVAGMCESERSCSINQDIGLASAFTIAHEMGHNFGMHHDGAGNQCGLPGKEPARLMAARLTKETSPFSWSSCSREYLTDFLDSGKGFCLDNIPVKREIYPRDLPAETYDIDAQCRLQFGPTSQACKMKVGGHEILQACKELWCVGPDETCVTNSIPAAEGTECNISRQKNGWCYNGECRNPKYDVQTVHGSWSQWQEWGTCSRTCEGGVSTSERECDNPTPRDGGKYCLGQRKRYRSCNVTPCPPNSEDFRQVQCSDYNKVPFRGRPYKWVPYSGEQARPCSLVCMAEGYNFYTERSAKVLDGTRCNSDEPHVCIDGECKHVGCDGYLHSDVKEDSCRVCGGDNSTCKTISGLVDKPLPTGAYQEIVKIPSGAMRVNVSETIISKNYLALKDTTGKYFINGEWTIDWPRKFPIAGTVFHYKLSKDEPESMQALGPTTQDLVIMMLPQEENRGIHFEYNLPINKTDQKHDISLYVWTHSQWSPCSKSCSKGTSVSNAKCVFKSDGQVVEDSYCDRQPKPSNHIKRCNEQPCPPKWSVGQWSDCSRSCGEGYRSRRVVCRQILGDRDQLVLDGSECKTEKPESERTCRMVACPPEWHTFEWSGCSPSCGPGEKTRRVFCMSSDGTSYLDERNCRLEGRPSTRKTCMNRECPPPQWRKGEWTQCSVTCGKGVQERSVQCQSFNEEPCNPGLKPKTQQACSSSCQVQRTEEENCEDKFQVAYCPLVLKFGYCERTYFQTMCCDTCNRGRADLRRRTGHTGRRQRRR